MADPLVVGNREVTQQFEPVRTAEQSLAIAYAALKSQNTTFPQKVAENSVANHHQLQEV